MLVGVQLRLSGQALEKPANEYDPEFIVLWEKILDCVATIGFTLSTDVVLLKAGGEACERLESFLTFINPVTKLLTQMHLKVSAYAVDPLLVLDNFFLERASVADCGVFLGQLPAFIRLCADFIAWQLGEVLSKPYTEQMLQAALAAEISFRQLMCVVPGLESTLLDS